MSSPTLLRCPAKINLGLEVVGRLPDGYHEIRTLFQAIDLADDLSITALESGLVLEVTGLEAPAGADNLVARAAALLSEHARVGRGARLHLHKRVPVGAGLGGGSSDAAVALMALDRLWETGLGQEGLRPLAEQLGADVPYFLRGGLCLGLGRGERLFPVECDLSDVVFVLVCPPQSVSTAQVYTDWDSGLTSGAKDSRLRRFLDSALSGRASWEDLRNDLQGPATQRAEGILASRAALDRFCTRATLMSGSGPAVFGVFLEPQRAEQAERELGAEGHRVYRCRALSRAEYGEFIGIQD
jgi:4-diphosphocytidyl-2-C-methyl-D-erythritol kinase